MATNINWIVTNFYIFILATLTALLEIQIEGKYGWAEKLPAWRPKQGTWYGALVLKLFGNDLTGYHFLVWILMFSFFHMPFFFGFNWSLEHEFQTLSLYLLFGPVWDFLWFVFNPYYPLKNFNKEHIPWHKEWILGLPKQYWVQVIPSFLAAIWLAYLLGSSEAVIWWIKIVAQFLVEILAAIFVAKLLNIDNWHEA